MQYLLMIYNNEAGLASAPKDAVTQMNAAYAAYVEAMGKAGVIRGGERLRPVSDATTVRVNGGKTTVLNGPYADTKEQLGGFFIVECADLDEAIEIAAGHPAANIGQVEIRPLR